MLRNCACLIIAHMVDATQLCGGVGWGGDDDILWTWTQGGCYATVLVLSLHTWWMLRNCAVGWGGVGWGWWHSLNLNTWWMLRRLCLSCHCTHGGCYATVRWGGVGWGGDDDLWENVENPGSWSRVLCNPVNTYGNCMMQSARGQQPGTLFTSLFTRFYQYIYYFISPATNHCLCHDVWWNFEASTIDPRTLEEG